MAHANRPTRHWNSPGPKFQPDVEDSPPPAIHRPNGANMVSPDDPAFTHICTAAMQLIEFGYEPNDPDVAERAIEVGRRNYEQSLDRRGEMLAREAAKGRHLLNKVDHGTSVVYYMRIGNRCKIGWSTNIKTRLATLNPEELMATEPGGRILELERHIKFKDLRTHGEWFKLEEPLLQHIEELRRHAERKAS